jgi:hypothetical protein
MNRFDDKQPEEKDPEYEELLTLLQHANLDAMFVDPQEQAQALSKVRARLFPTAHEVAQPELNERVSIPSKPKALTGKLQRQGKRLTPLANVLAAVLVVAALIGSALLIFGRWSPSQQNHVGSGPPIGPVGAPVKFYATTADGFERVFKITPGPYFLGELLEVDLSITNHTHTDYWLRPAAGSFCSGILKVTTTGGRSPHATDAQSYFTGLPETLFRCNWPLALGNYPTSQPEIKLPANQTITVKQYLQLTSSAHVTLTVQVAFLKATKFGRYVTGAAPASTTLQLFVNAHVPSDHTFSVKEQKTQVVVIGPTAVRDHLLSETLYACGQGSAVEETGGGEVRADYRISHPTITLHAPHCTSSMPEKLLWWTYVVGAPGYVLVSGRVNG